VKESSKEISRKGAKAQRREDAKGKNRLKDLIESQRAIELCV